MLDVVYSGLLLYLSFRFTTVMNIVIVISNWTYSFAVLFSLLRTVVRVALRFLVMPSNRLDG